MTFDDNLLTSTRKNPHFVPIINTVFYNYNYLHQLFFKKILIHKFCILPTQINKLPTFEELSVDYITKYLDYKQINKLQNII